MSATTKPGQALTQHVLPLDELEQRLEFAHTVGKALTLFCHKHGEPVDYACEINSFHLAAILVAPLPCLYVGANVRSWAAALTGLPAAAVTAYVLCFSI